MWYKKYIKACALVVLVLAGFARSEVIYIGVEGVIDNVSDGLNLLQNKIQVGTTFNGYYCYDSATLNSSSTSGVGEYWHYSSPYGVYLTIGGFNFQTDPQNVRFLMGVTNDYPPEQLEDQYVLISYNNLPIYDGVGLGNIGWQLDDYTHSALSSAALPTTAPVLSNWEQNVGLTIDGGKIVNGEISLFDAFQLSGIVTNVKLIPEPVSALLLGIGVVLLRLRNKRH